MSDSQTPASPATQGTSTPAPSGTQQSSSPASGTPATNGSAPSTETGSGIDYSKIDLNQHPGFREIRSKTDKQIESMNRQLQQLSQATQAERQRAARLEAELEQRTLAGADDYTKLEHHYKKEAQARQALEQRLQQYESEQARMNFLKTVQEEYGVTLEENNITDPTQAILSLAQQQRKMVDELKTKVAEYERKVGAVQAAEAHAPDLGGGEPVATSAIQRAFNDAMLRLDGQTADKLVRQAAQDGVALDRHAWVSERNKGRQA